MSLMIDAQKVVKDFGSLHVLKGIDLQVPVSYTHLTLPTTPYV